MPDSLLKKLSGPALAGLLLSGAPLLFSSALTYYTIANESRVAGFDALQWAALTVFCGITSTFALTPPTFLALVFGYFLGWGALLPVFALNMGAILLVNRLVHWIDRDRFVHFIEQNPKARNVLDGIRREERKVIFFTKLSPVLPFALTNLVFALSGARLRNILLGGFLGMVPRTVLAVWAGRQAREIRTLLENPNAGSGMQLAIGGLLIASVAGLYFVIRRAIPR
ncbi:TVP38/TMEM64 family protein [Larkinella soli]|uniref:TVP38/TMEM64 family protein n=1 Tax=Larkinella soli TaxID=1770527 RepID=UPI000FFC350A|nr:VTT domain-containing protein [Larkinella soli]